MKKALTTLIATAVMISPLLVSPPQASADWYARHHPRRAEVNRREHRQQQRIANGIRTGKLSPAEASQLENQERALKVQERQEVRANGGYLTKQQQRQLNQEENTLNHEIYQDKHN